MKNKGIIIITAMALLCGLAGPASAQSRFGFKLGGGLSYVGGGDINAGFQGISDLFVAEYSAMPGILVREGYKPFHLGLDINGEFFFHITPEIAIGFGAGFLTTSRESILTLTDGSDSATLEWTPKVSVVPLTLNFHYFIPTGSRVKLAINAGVGYYLASLDVTQTYFSSSQTWDMSAGGIGAHGGVGLEIVLAPKVSLVFDILGRFASISGFSGDATSGSITLSNGKIWSFEISMPGLGSFPFVTLDPDKPSGSGISNVREARLGLSGFTAGLSLLFRI